MIAGRYSSDNLNPKRIAQEIVSAYRESLEQYESGMFGEVEEGGGLGVGAGAFGGEGSGVGDGVGRALEAAQMCLEYCDDAEAAVSVLIMSRKWMTAVHAALKTNRRDLLEEEIGPAARTGARDMIKALPGRSDRQVVLVTELVALWKDTANRLKQVASSEPTLVAELNGGHLNPDGTVWKDKDEDDNKSEFSIASRQSGASGASYVSSASRSSVRSSASSSVSILSNLSVGTSGGRTTASDSAFSIDGLDHSLLSRGTIKPGTEVGGKREPERKTKRRQRKQNKGEGGRDIWGIRREAAVCNELWGLAQVSSVAKSAKDLCDVLVLLGSHSDIALAGSLQAAIDLYVKEVQANPPPVAPMYPPQWMAIRLMETVSKYQEISIDNNYDKDDMIDDDNEDENEIVRLAYKLHLITAHEKIRSCQDTWWRIAADGISLWQSYRRISLDM
jgi:hypothetical protein